MHQRANGKSFPIPPTSGQRKWLLKHGAQHQRGMTAGNIRPYIKAVGYYLRWQRYKKDRDVLDLLRETDAWLQSLSVGAPPQANVRGMKLRPRKRAQIILAHIYRQQCGAKALYRKSQSRGLRKRPHGRPYEAALRILTKVLAVEVAPKPVAGHFYHRTQIVRVLHFLLRGHFAVILGKRTRFRIRADGFYIRKHLYELVSRQYAWFLTDERRRAILDSKWTRAAARRAG